MSQLTGTTEADVLNGDENNDTLFGGQGNDTVDGGEGNDTAFGGKGNDIVIGDQGEDFLRGDLGGDVLYGGENSDTLFGGKDNDALFGGEDGDTLFGDVNDDYLEGGLGDDLLYGGEGNDFLIGGEGNDTLHGNLGNDTIFADDNDTVVINPEGGADILYLSPNTTVVDGLGAPWEIKDGKCEKLPNAIFLNSKGGNLNPPQRQVVFPAPPAPLVDTLTSGGELRVLPGENRNFQNGVVDEIIVGPTTGWISGLTPVTINIDPVDKIQVQFPKGSDLAYLVGEDGESLLLATQGLSQNLRPMPNNEKIGNIPGVKNSQISGKLV
jgi:RTX calcium-binding nonapeptide repeat (4 copies)